MLLLILICYAADDPSKAVPFLYSENKLIVKMATTHWSKVRGFIIIIESSKN